MADPDLKIGDEIEHYEIRGLLGKGGMGAVYLAQDHSLGRNVALKILPARLSQDEDIVARFQREARAMAGLRHPNLMHVYGVGKHAGRPYFTMEYVRGSTLSKAIANSGALALARAARLMREVLSALDKVHASGIVHRDIKSGNIMIDEDGRAVLMDFGLARREHDASLTADHTVLGTPAYMSPEQAKGEAVTPLSDIYSLGVVFFEMLTGAQPFKAKTSFEVLRQQVETPLPTPSKIDPRIPAALDRIVKKATAKEPAKRYPSAQEMAADIAKLSPAELPDELPETLTAKTIVTQPVAGGGIGSVWRRVRWFFSHPWRAAGFCSAVVVIAALIYILWPSPSVSPDPSPSQSQVPAVEPGRTVRLDRQKKTVIEGRLLEIQTSLDDGTTTVKIQTANGKEPSITIHEGDVLYVLPNQ